MGKAGKGAGQPEPAAGAGDDGGGPTEPAAAAVPPRAATGAGAAAAEPARGHSAAVSHRPWANPAKQGKERANLSPPLAPVTMGAGPPSRLQQRCRPRQVPGQRPLNLPGATALQ